MAKKQFGVVKITGGAYRGRTILTPPGDKTHPMGERERIALFNMLESEDAVWFILDAYAGSGAIGIEALSRGADLVVFVEKDATACRVIDSNLKELGIYNGGVLRGDVVEMMRTATDRFGIVIADPPYDKFNVEDIKVLTRVVARPGGVMVLSHPGEAPELPGMELIKTRKYAGAHLSIYHPE